MTSLTSSSPSNYASSEVLLDLANHHLKPGSFSTLKSGFLGYMTSGMSKISSEGVYHRNILWKENFLNTASLPSSIYNYAKIYEYPIRSASPSSCRILYGIFLDSIQAVLGAETGRLTISRGHQIMLDDVPFMVSGKIEVNVLEGNRISSNYDTGDMDFPIVNNSSFIRTYTLPQPIGTNGETRTLVYLELMVHQVTQNVSEFKVISSRITDAINFRVVIPNEGQLSGFTVKYRANNTTDWVTLPAYFNENVIPDADKYCHYAMNSDRELNIYFSTAINSFRPAYNSSIRVEFNTTLGKAGNFSFSGIPTSNLTSSDRPVPTIIELVTQPAGGSDIESLLEIKKGILNKLMLRGNIIIERDLVNYLQLSVDRTSVNDSEVSFIKKRDDLQKRLFATYLLIKDGEGNVVPSNTASLDLEISDLEARGWTLPPGTLIVYDRRTEMYRLLLNGEYPDQMANDVNSFLYCNPFLMAFRLHPFPRLVYYRNSVAEDIEFSTYPGEVVTADNFISNSMTVRRTSSLENNYQIDISLMSNLEPNDLHQKCIMIVRLFDEGNDEIGYLEAEHIDGTNIFRATIFTDDTFDNNSNLILRDSLWKTSTNAVQAAVPIPEDIRFKAELYYDNEDLTPSTGSISRQSKTFHLVRRFNTMTTVKLYESLERYMYGDMYVTEEGTFHCDNVPMIGSSFFLNPQKGQEINKIVSAYHSAIREIFDLLQNNTSVDIKFFRTYGPSSYFNTDRVNLSIKLFVKSKGRASEELRKQIIDQTVAFVIECNSNDRSRFSASNLITRLEQNIPDIAYIKFSGINGSATQNIQLAFPESYLEQDKSRIPEFVNVATLTRSSLDANPYYPDVDVQFL